jgi:hypothetical protein
MLNAEIQPSALKAPGAGWHPTTHHFDDSSPEPVFSGDHAGKIGFCVRRRLMFVTVFE